jgi:LPXTG-motif cell wall-anchored protein
MYALPKTGVGALVMTVVALIVAGVGLLLRKLGR